jgi:hypothetical protein
MLLYRCKFIESSDIDLSSEPVIYRAQYLIDYWFSISNQTPNSPNMKIAFFKEKSVAGSYSREKWVKAHEVLEVLNSNSEISGTVGANAIILCPGTNTRDVPILGKEGGTWTELRTEDSCFGSVDSDRNPNALYPIWVENDIIH